MWDRMKEKRNEGGFTLIELLIVIIILAILAAIVVFAVGNTGQNAKNASCSADAKTFETAIEAYKAEVSGGGYPAAGLGAQLTTTQPATGGGNAGPFMRELPATNHYTIWTDGSGGVWVYPAGTTTTPAFSTPAVNNFDNASANPCGNNSIVS